MNVLSNEQIFFYNDNGYLIVPGVIDFSEIKKARKVVFDTYKKFSEPNQILLSEAEPWSHSDFDVALLKLRHSDPELFGAMYDAVQNNLQIPRLMSTSSIVTKVADLLSTSADMMSASGCFLRMDAPQDKRNTLKWHQDRAYYDQNKDGNNGLVVTLALQNVSDENGALRICPGSHKRGFLGVHDDGSKGSYEASQQLTVSDSEVSEYEEISVNLKSGDILFINLNLFHRSGHNSSNRFRFTALMRFHNMMADDYVPYGILYNYSEYSKDKFG